jgi:CBS domain containing-hemolysin-like protein
MKDLVDINFRKDPKKVEELKLHKAEPIGSKTALDTSFRRFIAARTHLLPVEKNGEVIGIVTIEDLLEEIIGHEIIDESDHKHKRGLE